MRIGRAVVAAVLVVVVGVEARADLQCGTSRENDERVRALHGRARERVRVAAQAAAPPTLRNGAIYLQANEDVARGYRAFDLEGQSLVFRPRAENRYAVTREPLRYVEPAVEPTTLGTSMTADLGFTFAAFGRSVERVYVSRFLGITFDEPRGDVAASFSELEALLRPQPLIAPLMQTTLSLQAAPVVYVERTASSLIVTWRSTAHRWFGYDIQAELHQDGSIVFSYKSLRNMRWGTPVIAAGTSGDAIPRRSLFATATARGNTTQVDPAVRDMLDVTRVEVSRVADSEIFSIRLTTAAPIDASKVPASQSLRYRFIVGTEIASITIARDSTTVSTFNALRPAPDGVAGRVDGNTVEIFGLQSAPGTARTDTVNVATFLSPATRAVDGGSYRVPFDAAPRRLAGDLSAANATELALPILEPFILPELDPFAVWAQVQRTHGLRDDQVDGVAIYQTFFTDLILIATAYATGGNPQVDGIYPDDPTVGTDVAREATLMHMNQLNFDENADDRMASVLMLHEFGHRWLYKLQIEEGSSKSSILSPTSFHPAAYVDTRSAFPLYGPEESSVMGGGHFTAIAENRYRARAQQYGFSWTDLYLMGLAAPEEVPAWFYLAGTDPKLPDAYFPADGIEVTGTKREVALQQVLAVHGPRNPSAAASQRTFRVVFVLVTDPGREPTAEEIAKMDWLRAKMERDFATATGGRGRLITTLDLPTTSKRRSVR